MIILPIILRIGQLRKHCILLQYDFKVIYMKSLKPYTYEFRLNLWWNEFLWELAESKSRNTEVGYRSQGIK